MALVKVTDSQLLNVLKLSYASIFPEHGELFIGGNVISFMKESFAHVTGCFYTVTPKIDGERMLMINTSVNLPFYVNRKMDLFVIDGSDFDTGERNVPMVTSVLDGELYDHVFFAFDVLYWKNYKLIHTKTFAERFDGMTRLMNDCRESFIQLYSDFGLVVVAKEYYRLDFITNECLVRSSDFYTVCKEDFENTYKRLSLGLKRPLEYDGLVFMPLYGSYVVADNWKEPGNILYKWKPKEKETIDFCIDVSELHEGNVTEALVYGHKNFVAMKGVYILNDGSTGKIMNRNVVYECGLSLDRCTKEQKIFTPIRKRSDKSRPNFLQNANASLKLIFRDWDIDSIVSILARNDCSIFPKWQVRSACSNNTVQPSDTVVLRYIRRQKCLIERFEACKNDMLMKVISTDERDHRYDDCIEFEVRFGPFIERRHFMWLKKNLQRMGLDENYSHTLDKFDTKGIRRSFSFDSNGCQTLKTSVRKIVLDSKKLYPDVDIYGKYHLKICVSHESVISMKSENDSTCYWRDKKRWRFNYGKHWVIDLTEVVNSKRSDKPFYEVEIEHVNKDSKGLDILNELIAVVLRYVNKNSEVV